jgi:hypothetical protein
MVPNNRVEERIAGASLSADNCARRESDQGGAMPMIGVLGVVALVALVGRYGERLSRRGITVTGIAVTVLDCTNNQYRFVSGYSHALTEKRATPEGGP